MSARWPFLLAVLALAASPSLASAQCMRGSGHAHGGGADAHAQHHTSAKADGRTQKAIRELLGEERSRALLGEALLADPEFVRQFLRRAGDVPEWRGLAIESLSLDGPPTAPPNPQSPGDEPPDGAAPAHRCPMHGEGAAGHAACCDAHGGGPSG